jgi:hypothetical protein
MTKTQTPATAWAPSLAGLAMAMVVAVWMQPPPMAKLPFGKAMLAAAAWTTVTVMAGTLGLGFAESLMEKRPVWPAARDLLAAAAAWVLIPPVLLFWMHGSAWALGMGACAAAAMAVCVRGMIPAERVGGLPAWEMEEAPGLFAGLPPPDSGWPQAFAIAVCVEAAIVLANRDEVFWATVLMAVGAFLLVWKLFSSLNARPRGGTGRPALRAATAAVLAMLIVVPLLLARFGRTMGAGVEATAEAASRPRTDAEKADPNDAYQGIILFTVKDKETELPPVPLERDVLRAGRAKPLVIRFDGSYWYFQAPRRGPGMHPHLAHGDPVAASIYSTGWVPLAMQAHQTLTQPIALGSCGAMEVTLRNGDNRPGRIDMGVVLTDSTVAGKPSMYLGTEPIVSTEGEHFSFKGNPVEEELRFAIPARGGVRKFDEITVFFFPGTERLTLGARVGIEQFELMPR